MPTYHQIAAPQTISPSDNTANYFDIQRSNAGNQPFLAVDTVTLDSSTSATFTLQGSFDLVTWDNVKLLSAPATNYSVAYTGDVSSTEYLYAYDTTDNVLIPFVWPHFRWVVTLAGFTGSPSIVCRQGNHSRF